MKALSAGIWTGLLAALGCAALVALTQCSSIEQTQTASKLPTSNRYGSYLAGRFASGERDAESASAYFKKALSFDPQNPALLERALLSEVAGGDIDAASAHAIALVKQLPSAKLPRLVLGVRALRDGGYAEARDAFTHVTGNVAAEIAAQMGVAYSHYSEGNLDLAQASLGKLSSLGGAKAFALYHQALIQDLFGKAKEAQSSYDEANRLSDGESLRILQAYANYLARQGRASDAKNLYQQFLAKVPGNPVIKQDLALLDKGQVPTRLISNAKQGMAETLYGIAASSSDDGAVEIPVFYLQLALALDPAHELSLTLLADRMEIAERWDDANAVYQRFPKSSALYATSQHQFAQNLQRQERSEDALKVLRGILNGTAEDAQTYQALGDILRGDERYAEAAETYSKAVALLTNPQMQNWVLFYARGIAYERSKQWKLAEADLTKALQLKPDQPMVMNYLAYSWVDQGLNIQSALNMLKRAVELRPEDGYIVDSLGWAHYRLGNYEEAVEHLEKAVTLDPGQATINDHLGDAYWRVGRKLEAQFQWRHAIALKPEEGEEPKIRRKLEHGLEDLPNHVRAASQSKGGE